MYFEFGGTHQPYQIFDDAPDLEMTRNLLLLAPTLLCDCSYRCHNYGYLEDYDELVTLCVEIWQAVSRNRRHHSLKLVLEV
jgi:hypothetical protein